MGTARDADMHKPSLYAILGREYCFFQPDGPGATCAGHPSLVVFAIDPPCQIARLSCTTKLHFHRHARSPTFTNPPTPSRNPRPAAVAVAATAAALLFCHSMPASAQPGYSTTTDTPVGAPIADCPFDSAQTPVPVADAQRHLLLHPHHPPRRLPTTTPLRPHCQPVGR